MDMNAHTDTKSGHISATHCVSSVCRTPIRGRCRRVQRATRCHARAAQARKARGKAGLLVQGLLQSLDVLRRRGRGGPPHPARHRRGELRSGSRHPRAVGHLGPREQGSPKVAERHSPHIPGRRPKRSRRAPAPKVSGSSSSARDPDQIRRNRSDLRHCLGKLGKHLNEFGWAGC